MHVEDVELILAGFFEVSPFPPLSCILQMML
jgi:hypothetical protein